MEEKAVDKLFELISAIVKRPAMYQVSKVEDIYLVIFGYLAGSKYELLNIFHENFRIFVNEHFKEDFVSKSDYDWPRLIRFYSAGDKHSIELFGQLFEQFKG
ncbi:hypothetical protein ACPPVU_09410 [Mucilaginibacter sp. McL0603]|uniref:hypothetical protein n=1 Tax=Mucilaginibacter sp. McL0603 TaxID=3415670 RepID=UPI003CF68EDE